MIVTHPARSLAQLAVLVSALFGFSPAAQAQGEVNIYSYREPQLIDPLLKAFTDKTGIKANVVYAAAGLNERLAAEGQNSPADLLFTVDAGRLSEAKDAGLTQPVDSSALKQVVPAQFRDPGNHWFGAHHALARGLRLQGAREAGPDHLRGAGRPEVEGQDLHPLRPARLQYLADRHHHRPQGRGGDRGVAQGRQGQPGAQARRRRSRAGARHLLGQVRPGARQHLLHGADDEEREEPGAAAMGAAPSRSCSPMPPTAAATSTSPAWPWPSTRPTRPMR